MNNDGFKTLSKKVEKIENEININNFEPSFIKHIHDKNEHDVKDLVKKKYEKIKSEYKKELYKWVTDPLKNLTKVIEYTVHFVEQFTPFVSQIFNTTIKGNGKLEFAIELITMVIDISNTFIDIDFLKNSVNHFVIIMNERKTLTNENKNNDKKKNKFSLFRRNSTDIQ